MNNLNFKELSKSKGYINLKKDIIRDALQGYNISANKEKPTSFCFNNNGCIMHNTNSYVCNPEPCTKFKWIIDRAKHYSHITKIDIITILDTWESDRSYWYQNYYQDCNQPKINNNDILIVEDATDFKRRFTRGFRCPACGGISTSPTTCNSGIKQSNSSRTICNWKSYGLFGTLGKGLYVFMKDKALGQTIFKPLELEI